ncbi:MAG: DUF262 domain-containing protein [Chthonomonadales bacterium]|nr:DUF262 domain-containing protein [Chthonomonadales bacterium]
MKISTVLDHIDSGHMLLPRFQRGYVWNRDQVRSLFHSLYHGHPVGSLLVWVTQADRVPYRGDQPANPGVVKLLLDGQQRITTVYGVVRGQAPPFFDGDESVFTGLRFHLGRETFEFYQPLKMRDDPLWIDVTTLMKNGNTGIGELLSRFGGIPELSSNIGVYIGRATQLLAITEKEVYADEITGANMDVDTVVDIFNRLNSGGTKLSQGDLALAHVCARMPDARSEMREALERWEANGYDFTLDWLLRCVNTVLNGEARFSFLHKVSARDFRDSLTRAINAIETLLEHISGRLGLDHDRVLFGKFAFPVMVRYVDRVKGSFDAVARDMLLFWYWQAAMWGRYSGQTESNIDQDLAILENSSDGLGPLIESMRHWRGSLRVQPADFTGWSLGARFYPVLYALTRMGEARDWDSGLPLKANLLGKRSRLHVHHIFPKARLYARGYGKAEVNALANLCFLTQNANLTLGDELPETYFPKVEAAHPGALASQWIPDDPELWKIDRYGDFLEARQVLLADEANRRLTELLHGHTRWFDDARPSAIAVTPEPPSAPAVIGGLTSEEEEAKLHNLNLWVAAQGYVKGIVEYDLADPDTGRQLAVLDLAWPDGIQQGLSEPVALLYDEPIEVVTAANKAGFRCFTTIQDFRSYVLAKARGLPED